MKEDGAAGGRLHCSRRANPVGISQSILGRDEGKSADIVQNSRPPLMRNASGMMQKHPLSRYRVQYPESIANDLGRVRENESRAHASPWYPSPFGAQRA